MRQLKAQAIALLVLTIGYVKSGRVGIEAMPRVESDFAVVTAVLPYGSAVEKTMVVRDRLEAAARAVAAKNGGLAPMIFETSRQARFMIPMALSLGYGILFSTAITLVLVPSLYIIVEDVKRVFARRAKPVTAN